MTTRAWPSWLLVTCLAAAFPLEASAQPTETADRAAARELGEQGIAAFRAGRFDEALDRLGRAHALVQLTTTGLWRARCLVKLGRLVEAAEQYLEVTRMQLADDAAELHRRAIVEAGQERAALLPRIPHLRVEAPAPLPADLRVLLDGQELSAALIGAERPIDPGEHLLRLERGSWSEERAFELAEGGSLSVPIELPPHSEAPPAEPAARPPVAPPSSPPAQQDEPAGVQLASSGGGAQQVLGWIGVGLGGAGLVLGGVTGALALDRQSTLDAGCPAGDCPPPLHGDVDAFETLRLLSTVGFVAGGVLVAGGVVLLLTSPADDPHGARGVTTTLRLGPDGACLQAIF